MTEIKNLLLEREAQQAQIEFLEQSLLDLEADNKFLKRQNNALKLRCSEYSLRISKLENEIADMKFTRKYLTSEEAGKAFARELLGKPMTKADIEEEEFIANGEAHYEKFAFIGDDF